MGMVKQLNWCSRSMYWNLLPKFGERKRFLLWKAKVHWIDLSGEWGGKPCVAEAVDILYVTDEGFVLPYEGAPQEEQEEY